jgi:serine/threonine-protein kinase
MGRVFRAVHQRLGRNVALKILSPDLADNPRVASRFFSEARSVNQISHENIIEITDFFDDGPEKYYVMELLAGESLLAALRRDGALPVRRLLKIALQVCDALAAVHDAGMVHRDLKPENIYLIERAGRNDFVKLLDFGVVKLGNLELVESMSQTAAGAILGTPEYMSPEQVSSSPVDHRTDIYALGIILFEAVTGRKPFVADSFGEMVVQHLTVEPPKPTALADADEPIPPKLEALILLCLAKERERRPRSMDEIGQQLAEILAEVTLTENRIARRRSLRVPMLAGSTLLAAAALAAVVLLPRSEREGTHTGEPAASVSAPAPAPARVEVVFESSPPGAAVLDGARSLGTTPLTVTLDRADSAREFRLALAGYVPAVRRVQMSTNSRVHVQLTAVSSPTSQKAPARKLLKRRPSKKSAGRRGTLDPFGH